MSNKLIALSASRLKVLKDCSWLYFCKYGPMKLPDKTNTGAMMGSICHTVFESLLNPRHRRFHEQITTEKATIRHCPVVLRYVKKCMKRDNLPDDSFNLLDTMIVVGLMYDFYCTKGAGREIEVEHKFDIVNESPKYRITGFMDKIAKYPAKSLLRIVDYKSSKRQFEGDDLESNIQAMIYSLAARKIFPDLLPIVEFIFLQFPENPVQRLKFSKSSLDDFELYLAEMSRLVNSFTIDDAKKNYAGDKPMPKKGFSGPLMCGRAKKKGELKKDGTPMWACQYKFPFEYYALCNEDDNVIKTSFEDDLVPKTSKGEYIIKKKYAGCPRWNKKAA